MKIDCSIVSQGTNKKQIPIGHFRSIRFSAKMTSIMKFNSFLNIRSISNIIPVDRFTIQYVAEEFHDS